MGRWSLLLVTVLAPAVCLAQTAEEGSQRVSLGLYVPTIPRDEFKRLGISAGIQLMPARGRASIDLRFSGYHTDGGDSVFVFNPSVVYGVSHGRLGGSAGVGFAIGKNNDGDKKTALSLNFAATYLLKSSLWGEVRYAAARPTGLGGLTIGLVYALR